MFSSKFDISIININGCKNIEVDLVRSRLERFLGKNIFFIRSSNLKKEIQGYSPYIKDVKAEKHLPNIIDVFIEERNPQLVWINLSGSYLIDDEGYILEVIYDFEDLSLSQEDVDLLKGYGNLTEYAQENKDEEKTDDDGENEEEKQEELSTEERYKLFEQSRIEVISRVDQYWIENVKNIPDEYKIHEFVYSYEQNNYIPLDSIDKEIINSSKLILSIDFIEKQASKYIWESWYRFVIYYDLNHKIVFSTKRDLQTQIDDLCTLINELKKDNSNFSYIDLSSDIIVYEVDK